MITKKLFSKLKDNFIDYIITDPPYAINFTGLGNVLYFTPLTFNNKFEKPIHSTQKPVLLNLVLMMTTTEKSDTIIQIVKENK